MELVDGPLVVRPLAATDVPLLVQWLSDPRVLEFYDGRDRSHNTRMVGEHFYANNEPTIERCLVLWCGQPVGYIQAYPLPPDERELFGFPADEHIYATDQFIGVPALWGNGIGTHLLRATIRHLFWRGAERVVMAPLHWNQRAIRCYIRAGMRPVRVIPNCEQHEGAMHNSLLMVCDNPQGVTMRLASDGDVETVAALYENVADWLLGQGLSQWPAHADRRSIHRRIQRGETYLALLEHVPVGAVTLQDEDEWVWGHTGEAAWYIHGIAVRRDVSGRRLGRYLLRWAEVQARVAGMHFVRLDCWAENQRLRRYYQQAGFCERGTVEVQGWKGALYERVL